MEHNLRRNSTKIYLGNPSAQCRKINKDKLVVEPWKPRLQAKGVDKEIVIDTFKFPLLRKNHLSYHVTQILIKHSYFNSQVIKN